MLTLRCHLPQTKQRKVTIVAAGMMMRASLVVKAKVSTKAEVNTMYTTELHNNDDDDYDDYDNGDDNISDNKPSVLRDMVLLGTTQS